MPFSGTAVNDRLIRENPDLIKRWIRAHVRALVFVRQRTNEAAQIAAKELKLNADIARDAVVQVLQFMSPDDPGGFTEKGMRIFLRESAPRVDVDPDKVAITQVADLRLLREVQKEMGIHCRGDYLCQ